ncbi:protein of unknown function (plasmid) [Streptantibioticus cattleyicolor NRRL 8057 = DSM 46488]|nr:protein of unknown function [Streptantibioticus cattleyicolor NRRL 8057 = DSM 46488]
MPEDRQPSSTHPRPHAKPLQGGAWLPHGYRLAPPHSHAVGQLVYAAAGTLATATDRGTWVAPANRVTWTPPRFAHSHRFYGRTDVRLLQVPLDLCAQLVDHPSVFAVSPLLREALLALTDSPERRPGAHRRLLTVVVDELVDAAEHSLHLPEGDDDRLRAATGGGLGGRPGPAQRRRLLHRRPPGAGRCGRGRQREPVLPAAGPRAQPHRGLPARRRRPALRSRRRHPGEPHRGSPRRALPGRRRNGPGRRLRPHRRLRRLPRHLPPQHPHHGPDRVLPRVRLLLAQRPGRHPDQPVRHGDPRTGPGRHDPPRPRGQPRLPPVRGRRHPPNSGPTSASGASWKPASAPRPHAARSCPSRSFRCAAWSSTR